MILHQKEIEAASQMLSQINEHLDQVILPFWKNMIDTECGGFYGYMDYDLTIDKEAVKGCILNSRITWFFSNAYLLKKKQGIDDNELLSYATHGYQFLKNACLDTVNGGVFWSVTFDGKPEDTTKHTYNQAFAIYALSSYYDATKNPEALELAVQLFYLIEEKCTDQYGYLEAFQIDFTPESNDKLSENGVIADKTMNTLLHVFEGYTELYRVSSDREVKKALDHILDIFSTKIYNSTLMRQEVFFDEQYNSLIDLHSYGHDIESAWLMDRGVDILGDPAWTNRISVITKALTAMVFEKAFNGQSLANECEKGMVDENRIWWVQAEAVIGFLNGFQKDPAQIDYFTSALNEWTFIQEHLVDSRKGSEWFWMLSKDGTPVKGKPIVEPWKCPYHNGRMCFEVIQRLTDILSIREEASCESNQIIQC